LQRLKESPPYYRHHVGVYPENGYFVVRYQNEKYPKILPWMVRDFKKAGFRDLIITPSTCTEPLALASGAAPSPLKAPLSSAAPVTPAAVKTPPSPP
jgi:hypothetical protein